MLAMIAFHISNLPIQNIQGIIYSVKIMTELELDLVNSNIQSKI